ncbi:hypothetical protein PY365_08210 [Roseiarcaceae bacterium H3SJ34-1]|uniref:hypothetical protein n=1 Tax=Terripilifer ovatus TaxID=3032367 RepID=UPI003AB91C1B|nr:hypothetical protein [Roseiarcaceae bacterium H3SJ34-1]
MFVTNLISFGGAIALGCFISLDRQSYAGARDGAVIHGTLAAFAFLIAFAIKPVIVYADDFLLVASIGALVAARIVLVSLQRFAERVGHKGALQGDMVTLGTTAWTGAALASGSAKAVVFVLLVGAIAATLKARPPEQQEQAAEMRQARQVALGEAAWGRAAPRQVALRNSVIHMVDKLNRVSTEIRIDAEVCVSSLRLMSARMLEAERRFLPVSARQRGRHGFDPRGMQRAPGQIAHDRRTPGAIRA